MPVSCHKYRYRKSLICHPIVFPIQRVCVAENHLFAHCYSREQTQTHCSGLCYAGPSDMCSLYSLSCLKSDFSFVDFWNILLCYLINNFIFASDFILILFESIYFGLRLVFNFYWPSYFSTYFVICLLCFTQRKVSYLPYLKIVTASQHTWTVRMHTSYQGWSLISNWIDKVILVVGQKNKVSGNI